MDTQTRQNKLNTIGLDTDNCYEFAVVLNELLANYAIFYQNVRGYYWHIRGFKFFELQTKFMELQTHLLSKINDLAERILVLGDAPSHTYSMYRADSDIEESYITTQGDRAIEDIIKSLQTIVTKQRNAIKLAIDIQDESSAQVLQQNITEQEKLIWMYSAFLNRTI